MFCFPVKKAKIQLTISAEVDLNPESDFTHEEQLKLILRDFADNPHHINHYETVQKVSGRLIQERLKKETKKKKPEKKDVRKKVHQGIGRSAE
jgi:hypothetical protein